MRPTRIPGQNPSWAPHEDEVIRRLYQTTDSQDLEPLLPGRTFRAIQNRAAQLDIRKEADRWTAAQDKIIQEHYPLLGALGCAPLLEGRTVDAITNRAADLGVKHDPWTEEQKQLLAECCAQGMSYRNMAALIGKSRSACNHRAARLGLEKVPAPKFGGSRPRKEKAAKEPRVRVPKPVKEKVARVKKEKPANEPKLRVAKPAPAPKPTMQVVRTPKPDYRATTRPACGQTYKKKTMQRAEGSTAKAWYKYPRGSAEYKAGEAAHFANKRKISVIDEYGRPATVYQNAA